MQQAGIQIPIWKLYMEYLKQQRLEEKKVYIFNSLTGGQEPIFKIRQSCSYLASKNISDLHRTCNLTKRQRHTPKLTHTHLTIKNNRFSNLQDLIPTAQRARGGFICRFTPFPNRKISLRVVLAYKRGTDRKKNTIFLYLFIPYRERLARQQWKNNWQDLGIKA